MPPSSSQSSAPAGPDLPGSLHRAAFRAMGTEVTVVTAPAWSGVEDAVQDLFEEWEQALSRFRPESEVSRLNARPGRPFRAGPVLLAAVSAATAAARRTGGLFDPTLLDQLERAGYDRDFDELAPQQPPRTLSARPGGGWRGVEVDERARTVTVPLGCRLDLGGIGKGLAVDAAIAVLERLGAGWGAVDAGGDLRVLGIPPGLESWPVAVETGDGDELVGLREGALATSSTLGRRWRQGAEERHHLIDPRSGRPASAGVRSVTVAAPSCAQAEVDAKVALLLGSGLAVGYLEEATAAGLVVLEGGARRRAGSWPSAPGAA